MQRVKHVCFSIVMLLMSATGSHAAEIISVEQAFQLASNEDLVLLDIRRPAEWAQTGGGQHAKRVSMHDDDFLTKLWTETQGDKTKAVGLICAVGGRSAYVAKALESRGYTNVFDVSEGMMGNNRGGGWIAKKLPLVRVPE
ncbi:MAG: rhodanese-like domain-containing protein [Alphaproteobacteria bacterium]